MDCDFQPTTDGRFQCSRCGCVHKNKPTRNCATAISVEHGGVHAVLTTQRPLGATDVEWMRILAEPLWRLHPREDCPIARHPCEWLRSDGNQLYCGYEMIHGQSKCPKKAGQWLQDWTRSGQPCPWFPAAFPEITTRHLLYHLYPRKNNHVWRENLDQLRTRMELFSGLRVIAVAEDETTETLATVQRESRLDGVRWLTRPNDPRLGEVATFRVLLEQVAFQNPDAAVFYAHGKGTANRTNNPEGIATWRNAMYHVLLDEWNRVDLALRRYPTVGTHLCISPKNVPSPYPTKLKHGQWHYAGTFWWARCDRLFGHPEWRNIPDDRYGAEAYLAGLFPKETACSLYNPWPVGMYPWLNPYDGSIHDSKQ